MSQHIDQNDPLLAYCVALDAGDFDRVAAILRQAETDAGLIEAIQGIRRRFGYEETATTQLLRERASYQEVQ